MKVYELANGACLTVLDGGNEPDDPDQPVPYIPADLHNVPSDLEQRLARAEEMAAVWQDVARQFEQRCDRMIGDIATLTGRSRAAVTAIYVPEATGGASDPV